MRTEKSILNVESGFLTYGIRSVLSFIVRTIFIKVLGQKYLGLDGLFTNILFVLSITELGVSSAINYSLYKPLANKDTKKISSLMTFYKKLYQVIGAIIIIFGLIVMLFLDKIVKESIDINIYLVFLIYLFDTVNLYFISYKETLIIADQNGYKLLKYNIVFYIILYLLQAVELILLRSFYIYLLLKIVVLVIQRVLINRFISKEYNYVDFNTNDKIDKEDVKTIKRNVKGLFFHKAGFYAVNSTDNIIISAFLNLSLVGVYANYLSLISMTNTLLSSSYKAITASFGNLIVTEDKKMQEEIFEKINFAGHLLYSFVSIAFLVLINSFIELWVGSKYVLEISVVAIICLNFYLDGMRQCIDSVKDASGTYNEDKYVPILQAIVNIIMSIILVKFFGILGVVLGTLISYLLLPCWNRPYIIYRYVFKSSPKKYYINYLKNIMVNVFLSIIIVFIFNKLNLHLSIINFIISIIIYCILYIVLVTIIYHSNDNYKFYKELLIKKVLKKNN